MLWLLLVFICGILLDTNSASCGCKAQDPSFKAFPDHEGIIEGDIRLTLYQILQAPFRKYVLFRTFLWSGGVVPYVVNPHPIHLVQFLLSKRVKSSLDKISKATDGCVKFRKKKSSDHDYVSIQYGDRCYSNLGRIGGKQIVNLHTSCFAEEAIQHQFIHALGFGHEHNRADRDNHLSIHYDNLLTHHCTHFAKWGRLPSHCYDSESIMHLASEAFTCNGKPTMTFRNNKQIGWYQRTLTELDGLKIKDIYGCK